MSDKTDKAAVRKLVVSTIRRQMEGRDKTDPHRWWTNAQVQALLDEIDALETRLNTPEFRRYMLETSEQLWMDLERNELGGYSGINRPFYIRDKLRQVCERLLGVTAKPVEAADDQEKISRVVRLATDLTFMSNRFNASLWNRLRSALLDVGAEPELPNRENHTQQGGLPAYGPGSITDGSLYERKD